MAQIIPNAQQERNLIIDEQGSFTYIGVAKIGTLTSDAGWQIRRIQLTGTENKFLYANGSRRFNQIWDNRAALSYS